MKAAGEEGMEGVSAFEAYVHRAFAPDGLFSGFNNPLCVRGLYIRSNS